MTPVQLHTIIKQHEHRWLGLPGVRGVGGMLCGEQGWLVIYADSPLPDDVVPLDVDGVPVVIEFRERETVKTAGGQIVEYRGAPVKTVLRGGPSVLGFEDPL